MAPHIVWKKSEVAGTAGAVRTTSGGGAIVTITFSPIGVNGNPSAASVEYVLPDELFCGRIPAFTATAIQCGPFVLTTISPEALYGATARLGPGFALL